MGSSVVGSTPCATTTLPCGAAATRHRACESEGDDKRPSTIRRIVLLAERGLCELAPDECVARRSGATLGGRDYGVSSMGSVQRGRLGPRSQRAPPRGSVTSPRAWASRAPARSRPTAGPGGDRRRHHVVAAEKRGAAASRLRLARRPPSGRGAPPPRPRSRPSSGASPRRAAASTRARSSRSGALVAEVTEEAIAGAARDPAGLGQMHGRR